MKKELRMDQKDSTLIVVGESQHTVFDRQGGWILNDRLAAMNVGFLRNF
jgi:hypothetical protein